MTPDSALMTLQDFAAWSALSRTTIWRQVRAGRLRAIRVGGRTMIKRQDAQAWLDSQPPVRALPVEA